MNKTLKACVAVIAAGGIAVSSTTASAFAPRQTTTPDSVALTGNNNVPIKLAVKPKQEEIIVAGRRRRGRGAAIGLGIIAGVGTALLLSGAARAHRRDHYYDDYSYRRARHYDRCERWDYRCHELGVRRACRKFYRRCR